MASCNDSARVFLFWKEQNINNYLGPTFSLKNECTPPEWLPIQIIGGVCWLLTCIVFLVSTNKFEEYRWTQILRFTMTKRVTGYYVLFSLLNLLTIINPRSAYVYSYISDFTEALVMVNFYHLMWSYVGGNEIAKTFTQLIGLQVNLGNPPLCCLRCLPLKTITKPYLRFMEIMLLQLPTIQLTVGLLNLSLIMNGVPRNLGQHWATTSFVVILTISAVFSIYSIGTLFRIWARFIIGKRVAAKFAIFKMTIIVTKLQDIIFGLASSAIPSYGYYSGRDRAMMWGSVIVTVECLLLVILASFLYVKEDFEDADDLTPVKYQINEDSVDKNLNDRKMLEDIDLGQSPGLVMKNPNN